MKRQRIVVNDLMQTNYVYLLTEPIGKNFNPCFHPDLTPKEMLTLGVFGGKYMTDCTDEFPDMWFDNAKLCSEYHNPDLNYFRINTSLPLSIWKEKGWIHPEDPHGWFQWYCRYFMGRRYPDDERQIKRWRMMRRHIAQIRQNCSKGDINCRRKQRQALLHWGYNSLAIYKGAFDLNLCSGNYISNLIARIFLIE